MIATLHPDPASFARLERLRRAHFPPRTFLLPAHLTLFHKIPGEAADAFARSLRRMADVPAPALRFVTVMDFPQGAAIGVEGEALASIRSELADEWRDVLSHQDSRRFRPHVTVQNRARPEVAAHTQAVLRREFEPWDGYGASLRLYRYLGGPWAELARVPFRNPGI